MDEPILLGIDGGGTTTRALLTTAHGRVLGLGRGGPSNYDDIGIQKAQENIQNAVTQAWVQAGQPPRPAEAAFLGMAGVVSEADRAVIAGIASNLGLAALEHTGIDHDIRIALAGGLALKPGIVLIAGTGSSCYGRNASGESCRVGGWGHLLDDGGSSYFLGLKAMRAAVRSADGRLGATTLLDKVLSALQLINVQDLMHRIYSPQISRSEIAALAPLVVEAAAEGDHQAETIIHQGQEELALLVEVAARRLNFPAGELLVTATGGLAQSGDAYRLGLYERIQARLPEAQIVAPALSPVFGAALLAIQSIGPLHPQAISSFQQYEGKSQ